MTATEERLPSLLEVMHEGMYDPVHGRPVPIELINRVNTISYETYQQILYERKEEEKQRKREYAKERTAAEMAGDSDILEARMARALVPKAFTRCHADLTYADKLLRGGWLYVHGNDVESVTIRACAAMKGWMRGERYATALFERSTTMTVALDATDCEQAMANFNTVNMLLISGMGAGVTSDYVLSNMHAVLDMRHMTRRPVIFTSRYGVDELSERLGSHGDTARELAEMIAYNSEVVEVR